jgi:glycosyltransferase involved in cell wall biosynthesis
MDHSKTIVSFRGGDILILPWSDPEWHKFLVDKLFPSINCVHFISQHMEHEGRSFGGELKNSRMIYMGIDTRHFSPMSGTKKTSNRGDEINITTTGRLTWQKGYLTALQAVKILRDRRIPVRYQIIGGGSLSHAISYWIRHLGIEENVHLVGQVDRNQVKEFLAQSDIYIQPSLTESLCVSVMEAMAMELPVVASKVGGLPEVVENGVTGLLAQPGDPQSLADAISYLVANQDLANEMGKAGRQRVLEKFTIEHEREEWLKFYASL